MIRPMTRREWLLASAVVPLWGAVDRRLSFSVFSLFHPKELLLRPTRHSRLHTSTKQTLEGGETLFLEAGLSPMSASGAWKN